jgi:hypothetical protein
MQSWAEHLNPTLEKRMNAWEKVRARGGTARRREIEEGDDAERKHTLLTAKAFGIVNPRPRVQRVRLFGGFTLGECRVCGAPMASSRKDRKVCSDRCAKTHRMSQKYDKGSDERRALRALREIRTRAAPSWDAHTVHLMFWFIRNKDQPTFATRGWDVLLEAWLARAPAKRRFANVDGAVLTLDYLKVSPWRATRWTSTTFPVATDRPLPAVGRLDEYPAPSPRKR